MCAIRQLALCFRGALGPNRIDERQLRRGAAARPGWPLEKTGEENARTDWCGAWGKHSRVLVAAPHGAQCGNKAGGVRSGRLSPPTTPGMHHTHHPCLCRLHANGLFQGRFTGVLCLAALRAPLPRALLPAFDLRLCAPASVCVRAKECGDQGQHKGEL